MKRVAKICMRLFLVISQGVGGYYVGLYVFKFHYEWLNPGVQVNVGTVEITYPVKLYLEPGWSVPPRNESTPDPQAVPL